MNEQELHLGEEDQREGRPAVSSLQRKMRMATVSMAEVKNSSRNGNRMCSVGLGTVL
jgi:hypothetical protein